MQNTLTLVDLGEGLLDAEVVMWHVGEGDHVTVDQPMVSVETDKAVVEIPSPHKGIVTRLCAAVGNIVKVGEVLVEYDTGEAKDKGTVVGDMHQADQVSYSINEPSVVQVGEATQLEATKAMPIVRQAALQRGIDLDCLPASFVGSGPDQSISLADLDRLTHESEEAELLEGFEKLRGVRRTMAKHMVRSHSEVVPVTITDMARIGNWIEGEDITARLIRAMVAGASAAPALNAHFDSNSKSRRLFRSVHLGVAMDSEEGLFVPVMHNAELQTLGEIRQSLAEMKQKLLDRLFTPEQLKGSTLTLSNFGMLAGRYATPIVVPPSVAILGAGRLYQQAFNNAGKVDFETVIPLSFTFDHRAVTGSETCHFLAAVIQDLEQPS